MNTLVSVAILLVIVFVAILLVLAIGRPTFDSAIKASDIKGAEDDLHFIDEYIRTTAREGRYAFRNYKFSTGFFIQLNKNSYPAKMQSSSQQIPLCR